MPGRPKAVLALDLGSTTSRAALFAFDGTRVATAALPSQLTSPERGRAEHDPEAWWRALRELVGRLLDEGASREVELSGLAISAFTRTQVFLSGDGAPVRPAITWRDGRAGAEAARLAAAIEAEGLGEALGTTNPPNAFHPLARVLWVQAHEPARLARTRWVLSPKDYLNYRLTGVAAGDLPQGALVLDPRTLELPRPLFARLELDPALIPPMFWPETPLGPVRAGLPPPLDRLAGIPVFTGSLDAWCCTLGIGAMRAGAAYVASGTSDILGILHPRRVTAAGLTALRWTEALWHLGGVVQTGGDCLAWLAALLGEPAGRVMERLAGQARPASVPLFLPYLAGERTPLWDPDVRAGFLGVDRRHSALHLAWAVLEGVAFADRHGLELAFAASGSDPAEVRLTGGAARFDAWCQARADVLGRTIVRTREPEAGLLGAAMVALRGLGEFRDWDEAQARLVRVERRFEPDLSRADRYARLFAVYKDFSAWSVDPSRRLAEASSPRPRDA